VSTVKRERAARWLRGSGIEIGALDTPLSVPPGVTVQYVDRVPTDRLHEQYRELADAEFVPVSIIGDAQNLSVLADESVDFVIANHLLEHLEDPISGLREMLRVIRRGGVLYMALPDPRATFDVDRELTSVDHVLDEFRNGTQHTREAHFAEWVENAERHVDWMQKARVQTGPARVRELIELDYSIHFHVWRPDTFLEFLVAATREAGLELELVDFIPRQQDDNEYIFVFLKGIAAADVAVPPLPEESRSEERRAEIVALRAEVDHLRRAIQRTEDQLAAVTVSNSWRLTAPLRAATSAVLRLRQRVGRRDLRG
jgi:predicted SAM-dependent methyltransferase